MDGFWAPFILGFITFGVLFIACFLTYASSQQQQKRVLDAATAASLSKDNILEIFSREAGGLPPWLRHLDSEHPTWINQALSILWPHIDHAATTWAFKDRNLENLLNEQDFWKPSWLAASGVVLQSLSLGQQPPSVTGLKIYSSSPGTGEVKADSLTVDVDFDWVSKMNCIIVMKTLQTNSKRSFVDKVLSVVYKAITIKVVVKNIVARGQMRVIAAPLLSEIPVVGAFRGSFLGPPTISYNVSSFGLSPMFIPGLESWIQSFITNQVLQPFTFPEGLELNIAELFGVAAHPPPVYPKGVLSVIIHKADNIPRMDTFGAGADPYVKLYLTDKLKQRTSVKARTRFPKWEETFDLIVHDEKYQQLTLEIWDSDALSRDDMVGRVVVPLSSSKLDLSNEKVNSLELTIQRMGRKERKKGIPTYVEDDGGGQAGGGYGVGRSSGAGKKSMIVRTKTLSTERANEAAGVAPAAAAAAAAAVPARALAGGVSIEAVDVSVDDKVGTNTSLSTNNASQPQQIVAEQKEGTTATTPAAAAPARVPASSFTSTSAAAAAAAVPSLLAHAARQGLEDIHILSETGCSISCTLQYFKFTSQEREAAKHVHDGTHPLASTLSRRVSRLLRGGMLYVHLLRAEGLSPHTGVTKTYKLFLKIGPQDGTPVYKKSAERSGMGRGLDARSPVFDERLDLLIDGDTAQRRDTMLTVEIWVKHFLLKPTFKGAVTMPLSSVLVAGKVRDIWAIEGGAGTLEMGVEWQGMMHAI
jgi:C2 domain